MAPAESPAAAPPSPLDANPDMHLIRYLVQKYPMPQLVHMVSVASEPAGSDCGRRSSVSSAMSGASSWRSSLSSFMTSVSQDSLGSNHSTTASSLDIEAGTPASGTSSTDQRIQPPKALPCPFCAEHGIQSGAKKLNDLERHFLRKHYSNAEWMCNVSGCSKTFDFVDAYRQHMKAMHPGINMPENDVKTTLLPQLVFGCGIAGCEAVCEATSTSNSKEYAKDYYKHIAKHVADGVKAGRGMPVWDYSTQLRNLLRQKATSFHWERRTHTSQGHQFVWQKHNSNVLLKRLQCRVLDPIELCIDVAILLGSGAYCQPGDRLELNDARFMLPSVDNYPLLDTTFSGSFLPFGCEEDNTWSTGSTQPINTNNVQTLDGTMFANGWGSDVGPPQSSVASPPFGNAFAATGRGVVNQSSQPASAHASYAERSLPQQTTFYFNDEPPQHPLQQFPGVDSLGDFPTVDDVISDHQSPRSPTPKQRIAHLFKKKSNQSLRSRKGSTTSLVDVDMLEAVPPVPTIGKHRERSGSNARSDAPRSRSGPNC